MDEAKTEPLSAPLRADPTGLTPVTLSIARTLKVHPFPYLISQIFDSNFGGTATLIGDPPNILIGSAAALDFGDFLGQLAPIVVLIMSAFVGIMWLAFGRNMEDDADRLDILAGGTRSTVGPFAARSRTSSASSRG